MEITRLKGFRATLLGLGLILLTSIGIVAYNSNKAHSSPIQTSISDTIPHKVSQQAKYAPVSGEDYDEVFVTMINFTQNTASDCFNVNIHIEVKNDVVKISNPVNGDIILSGVAVAVSPDHATLVCKGLQNDGTHFIFTLTRFCPSDKDITNPYDQCIIFHMGGPNIPSSLFSKKHTCAELRSFLNIP